MVLSSWSSHYWGLFRLTELVINWCLWETTNCPPSTAELYPLITEELLNFSAVKFCKHMRQLFCAFHTVSEIHWSRPPVPCFPGTRSTFLLFVRQQPGTTPHNSFAVSCQLPWSVTEQDSTGTVWLLDLCL